MKKLLPLILSTLILFSCSEKKPVEISIPKSNVELTGSAFQSFKLGGEVKLLMVSNPEDNSKWMIRAIAPIQKTDALTIEQMTADLNLLDENGTKLREGFVLTADDLEHIVPVFNAGMNTEKNIVFSAGENQKRDFTFNEASQLINRVKKIGLIINTTQAVETAAPKLPEATATTTAIDTITTVDNPNPNKKANPNKPLTLDDLLRQHNIYGMLAQYEKHWKNGDRTKAKQVEDQLWAIERRVSSDNSIPKSLRERFVSYIENKEDEIERRY